MMPDSSDSSSEETGNSSLLYQLISSYINYNLNTENTYIEK